MDLAILSPHRDLHQPTRRVSAPEARFRQLAHQRTPLKLGHRQQNIGNPLPVDGIEVAHVDITRELDPQWQQATPATPSRTHDS